MAITEKEFKNICRSNSVEQVKAVIASEKNFSKLRFHEMDTPLIIAAQKANNPEILKLIIEAGVDVNARNEDGADVKLKDNKGRDIFHYVRKAYSLHDMETIKRIEEAAK